MKRVVSFFLAVAILGESFQAVTPGTFRSARPSPEVPWSEQALTGRSCQSPGSDLTRGMTAMIYRTESAPRRAYAVIGARRLSPARHAAFGIQVRGNPSRLEMRNRERKNALKTTLERSGSVPGYTNISVTLHGQTLVVVVHAVALTRIQNHSRSLQRFLEEALRRRDPKNQQGLAAKIVSRLPRAAAPGLDGPYLILDAIRETDEAAPALYGNGDQDGYIYLHFAAPNALDVIAVGHELLHESGVGHLEADEEVLARQDRDVLKKAGIDLRTFRGQLADIVDFETSLLFGGKPGAAVPLTEPLEASRPAPTPSPSPVPAGSAPSVIADPPKTAVVQVADTAVRAAELFVSDLFAPAPAAVPVFDPARPVDLRSLRQVPWYDFDRLAIQNRGAEGNRAWFREQMGDGEGWQRRLVIHPFAGELGACSFEHQPKYIFTVYHPVRRVYIDVGPEEVEFFGLLGPGGSDRAIRLYQHRVEEFNNRVAGEADGGGAEESLSFAIEVIGALPDSVAERLSREDAARLRALRKIAATESYYQMVPILDQQVAFEGRWLPITADDIQRFMNLARDEAHAGRFSYDWNRFLGRELRDLRRRIAIAVGMAQRGLAEGWNSLARIYSDLLEHMTPFSIWVAALFQFVSGLKEWQLQGGRSGAELLRWGFFGSGPSIEERALLRLNPALLASAGLPISQMRFTDFDFSRRMLEFGRAAFLAAAARFGITISAANHAQENVDIFSDAMADAQRFPPASFDVAATGIIGTAGEGERADGINKKMFLLRHLNRLLDERGYLLLTVKNRPIPPEFQRALADFGFRVVTPLHPGLGYDRKELLGITRGDKAKMEKLLGQLRHGSYLVAVKERDLSEADWQGLIARQPELAKKLEYDDNVDHETTVKGPPSFPIGGSGVRLDELNYGHVTQVPRLVAKDDILRQHPFFAEFLAARAWAPMAFKNEGERRQLATIQQAWDNPAIDMLREDQVLFVLTPRKVMVDQIPASSPRTIYETAQNAQYESRLGAEVYSLRLSPQRHQTALVRLRDQIRRDTLYDLDTVYRQAQGLGASNLETLFLTPLPAEAADDPPEGYAAAGRRFEGACVLLAASGVSSSPDTIAASLGINPFIVWGWLQRPPKIPAEKLPVLTLHDNAVFPASTPGRVELLHKAISQAALLGRPDIAMALLPLWISADTYFPFPLDVVVRIVTPERSAEFLDLYRAHPDSASANSMLYDYLVSVRSQKNGQGAVAGLLPLIPGLASRGAGVSLAILGNLAIKYGHAAAVRPLFPLAVGFALHRGEGEKFAGALNAMARAERVSLSLYPALKKCEVLNEQGGDPSVDDLDAALSEAEQHDWTPADLGERFTNVLKGLSATRRNEFYGQFKAHVAEDVRQRSHMYSESAGWSGLTERPQMRGGAEGEVRYVEFLALLGEERLRDLEVILARWLNPAQGMPLLFSRAGVESALAILRENDISTDLFAPLVEGLARRYAEWWAGSEIATAVQEYLRSWSGRPRRDRRRSEEKSSA